MAVFLFVVCLIPRLYAAGASEASHNTEVLVDTQWLAQQMASSERHSFVIVDFRESTREYERGHLPRAIFMPRDGIFRELGGVPNMLPPVEELAQNLGQAGIGRQDKVIIYDRGDGLWAARLFWTLEYLGHEDVRLLNGGWAKWKRESRAASVHTPSPAVVIYNTRVHPGRLATKQWLTQRLGDAELTLLDVRTPEEYAGSDRRSERGGHIPGAVNIEWKQALKGNSKTFLSPETLGTVYTGSASQKENKIVAYCQTGVRAAHTYVTLRYLGYSNICVYDGSWAEWGNDPLTRIETLNSRR